MEKGFVEGGEGEWRDGHFVESGVGEEDVPAGGVVTREVRGEGEGRLEGFFFGGRGGGGIGGVGVGVAVKNFCLFVLVGLPAEERVDVAFVRVDVFKVGGVDWRDVGGTGWDDAGLHDHLHQTARCDKLFAGDFEEDLFEVEERELPRYGHGAVILRWGEGVRLVGG